MHSFLNADSKPISAHPVLGMITNTGLKMVSVQNIIAFPACKGLNLSSYFAHKKLCRLVSFENISPQLMCLPHIILYLGKPFNL